VCAGEKNVKDGTPEGGSFPSHPVLTTFRFSVLPMLIFL
jgi:hypothetical protein